MVAAGIIRPLFECYGHRRHFSPPPSHCDRACAGRICTGPRESVMKKLIFSAAIMMIVTSPALAAGLGIGDCKGCSSSALQEGWGPPVPPAAYPGEYPNSPGYNYSYGYKISNAKRQKHGRH